MQVIQGQLGFNSWSKIHLVGQRSIPRTESFISWIAPSSGGSVRDNNSWELDPRHASTPECKSAQRKESGAWSYTKAWSSTRWCGNHTPSLYQMGRGNHRVQHRVGCVPAPRPAGHIRGACTMSYVKQHIIRREVPSLEFVPSMPRIQTGQRYLEGGITSAFRRGITSSHHTLPSVIHNA